LGEAFHRSSGDDEAMAGSPVIVISPRFLADAVLLVHAAFVLWVALGGLAVLRWPRLAWLHLPALVWGVWIIGSGGLCPLTPLEDTLRRAAGEAGYAGGFIEHWVQRLIYPPGLERWHQGAIAALLLAFNGFVYGRLWLRRRQSQRRN
jgi:Protein of Unknown function (DUF2784)